MWCGFVCIRVSGVCNLYIYRFVNLYIYILTITQSHTSRREYIWHNHPGCGVTGVYAG